jgi:predicted metal-dependent HD superfamily phosphohydrolase
MDFQGAFIQAILRYDPDPVHAEELWQEAVAHYSAKGRFYHTITHLEGLYQALIPVRNLIEDWDCILFSILYHDFVYSAIRHDNEEKSAVVARERLSVAGFPAARIALCVEAIEATKGHAHSRNADIDYFTDADLCILGSVAEVYTTYAVSIRQEYSVYPNVLYRPGRKKVLEHFLKMDRIFKTEFFFARFETPARANLQRELQGEIVY